MTTMNNEDPADQLVRPLVERLRGGVYGLARIDLCSEAADEIERLMAERERSHELLQAADHIHAALDAELAALRAEAIAAKRERDYLRWRMREIIPLFEEARDALCAISIVAATAYRVDLSLGSRMDAAGTRTREEFEATKEKK